MLLRFSKKSSASLISRSASFSSAESSLAGNAVGYAVAPASSALEALETSLSEAEAAKKAEICTCSPRGVSADRCPSPGCSA